MLSLLIKIDQAIARAESWMLVLFAAFISIILISQVVLRYLFSNPLFWAEEISTTLLVFMTFIGLSLLVHDRRLINLMFVLDSLPATVARVINIILDILVILTLSCLFYYSLVWVSNPITQTETSATLKVPLWYIYAVLPGTLLLMIFHYIVASLKSVFSKPREKSE